MNVTQWIRGHIATTAIIGGLLVVGGTGAAVAVVSTQPPRVSDTSAATSDGGTESDAPTTGPTSTPTKPLTLTGGQVEQDAPGEQGTPGGGSTPNEPAPVVVPEPAPEPAPEPPPAPPVPDAPYPSVYSDGVTLTVSWGTPNMNGATLAYYWVDVTNASYSTGDRHTPVYGNSITTNLNYPCAVIGIVTTQGVQSVSGVYCL